MLSLLLLVFDRDVVVGHDCGRCDVGIVFVVRVVGFNVVDGAVVVIFL